jgi:hypothetical protein
MENGDKYEGWFVEGIYNGKGIESLSNGYIYEGSFENGIYHGHGKLKMNNGDFYDGKWKNGKKKRSWKIRGKWRLLSRIVC